SRGGFSPLPGGSAPRPRGVPGPARRPFERGPRRGRQGARRVTAAGLVPGRVAPPGGRPAAPPLVDPDLVAGRGARQRPWPGRGTARRADRTAGGPDAPGEGNRRPDRRARPGRRAVPERVRATGRGRGGPPPRRTHRPDRSPQGRTGAPGAAVARPVPRAERG